VIRHSAIYQGAVHHARRRPGHAFRFPLAMLYLDLDELPELLAGAGPLRAGRLGLLSFHRGDYLPGAAGLADEARDRVERALGRRPAGPVRLLCQVRSLGYVFNPVAFYYCFEAGGERLEAVVAEITNTPWGERHCYVLAAGEDGARDAFPKAFHVSPFHPMAQLYRWHLGVPGDRLVVDMANREGEAEVFRARLELTRRPWTAGALWWAALRHPLLTWRIHLAIYLHALWLWLVGAAFHAHPASRVEPAPTLPPREPDDAR
jgi:DUF1365 family protein